MPDPHPARLERARLALEGLSTGDAFGEQWFYIPSSARQGLLTDQTPPSSPWPYTDDTQMALSIVAVLRRHQTIDQDALAHSFAAHYEPARKYGAAAHGLLQRIRAGGNWQAEAGALFGRAGSFGNGGAMRVAPVGGYFADDLAAAAEQAQRAAAVTHAHPEGRAGAMAVAVAAAVAWQTRQASPDPADFIDAVLPHLPESEVKRRVGLARDLASQRDVGLATAIWQLGNGSQITAQDTVAFCLWLAARHLGAYEAALWTVARAGGDIDTNGAIVGGILALTSGLEGIPAAWRKRRESLPDWPFADDTPTV